jgi:hypothetical protein
MNIGNRACSDFTLSFDLFQGLPQAHRSFRVSCSICAAFSHRPFYPNGRFHLPTASAIALALVAGFPTRRPRSGHVEFVVDKVALGQVFSEYFGFPCQFTFHRLLHTHHLSAGAGTTGQVVADVPSRLSLTPPQESKKNYPPAITTEGYYLLEYDAALFRYQLAACFCWLLD